MPSNKLAELFSFKAYLAQNGKVDIRMESVNSEEFIRIMEHGMPEYEGTFKVASLLKYLNKAGGEMMNKSNDFVY
tara:strand:+ start:92 stop:316 length:225 start_codon:yes stop_codon:yes gene_type:complete